MLRPIAALALSAFVLCACQVASPIAENFEEKIPRPPISSEPPSFATPAAVAPATAPQISRFDIQGIHFEGVSFDARSHRLLVIDQPAGPASLFGTSQDVAREHTALLAINAGFFTPEGEPLGLVISRGSRAGSWNSASSLGSGIFAESASGHLSIMRRSSPSAFSGARELIQAGPLLVESGKMIGGLDAEKLAIRSILLTDGGSQWWVGKTSFCSLSALGHALASTSPAPWPVRHALNLDGGRSTDLFVSREIPGGAFERRSVLNRPVRNFLILKPR